MDPAAKKISDVIVRHFDSVTTEYYLKYIDAHPAILERLEQAILKDHRFSQVVRDFEGQKVCYLPLTTLLVKPLHRILHYDLLLESKRAGSSVVLIHGPYMHSCYDTYRSYYIIPGIIYTCSHLVGLMKHYSPSHPDYHSTNMALVKMQSIIGKMSVRLRETVSQPSLHASIEQKFGG